MRSTYLTERRYLEAVFTLETWTGDTLEELLNEIKHIPEGLKLAAIMPDKLQRGVTLIYKKVIKE